MEEWKIGEIRQVNGEWYQCVESDSCGECSLFTTECGSGTKSDLADKVVGQCSKIRRTDNKHVIFKKLEKIGEPFIIKGKKYQRYITHVHPYILNELSSIPIDDSSVLIEIKQTQEDMEEKKLNLKPFDIQKAREGKPVCTRDGHKARIICFDAKGMHQPIIALLTQDNGIEHIETYYSDGRFNDDSNSQSDYDLMMLPEKKEGWVNVYKNQIHDTPESAEGGHKGITDYIKTIRVEWED